MDRFMYYKDIHVYINIKDKMTISEIFSAIIEVSRKDFTTSRMTKKNDRIRLYFLIW
jgi:hypothetical protein